MKEILGRARYRSLQFFKAVSATVTQEDLALVESVLTNPAQRELFQRMTVADRRHAVALLRALRAQRHTHPALMQAALLHDVAKSGAGISVFHRVVIVLLQALRPGWLAWLADDGGGPWRRPFAQYLHHPTVGAGWAEAAGCLPLAVSMIRRHQLPLSPQSGTLEDELLGHLQAADDQN